ncbi:MAG: hypothetical protein QGG40_08620, partial [Myxococcota bacterium]|nr:hypothetical protein [Myxococcota bacterium]
LDTNAAMWSDVILSDFYGTGEEQLSWLSSEVSSSTATWKVAYGHHPYRSNGQHGNAGDYEGYSWIPVASGESVSEFMDDGLCGQVDLYLCGHDHNRQWLEPVCGVELMVSGAAAKTTDLEGRGNATFFEDDQTEGFVWVELRDEELTGEFYDSSGTLDFEQTVTR